MNSHNDDQRRAADTSIGRIVSVNGSKAIVLLDGGADARARSLKDGPDMGTLIAIETSSALVLAIVSALSVPVPSQREGDGEVWIAEIGLVGELVKALDGKPLKFNRGVTNYPALGDRARVASKSELQCAFCGEAGETVRVGCIRQDSSIPAMVRVDELLGKHFAILGTTRTGQSCTTALILRSILEKHPAAHIVLLDPHNEYATAFTEWAEVVSPRNMHLPYWLLTFEEIVEVLVGDGERKTETDVLQDLIPVAKARYANSRSGEGAKPRRADHSRYTVDTPVPYRISELVALIDERMGRLENKRDLTPYRNLKHRIETVSKDIRYSFMFGSLTVYDSMTQILSRIFRVPVNNKPITILELTGIPSEIVNVVVSVLCRLTFDFALWSEGQVPVTLVCEEAHRYVPANSALGFEPCKRAIAKIAKEGRKYGASLCIVTQRPAEIDPTILSQCNTVFALRMSNDRDQEIVTSAVADTGAGLLEFLPSLGQREAIAFGDGMALPVRIKFDELPPHALPRSSTARFSERWQKSLGDDGFLEQIVERWRLSGTSTGDNSYNMALMADALSINSAADTNASPAPALQGEPRRETPPARGSTGTSIPGNGHPASRKDPMPPTYTPPAGHSARSASAASMMGDRVNAPGMSPTPARAPSEPPSSLRSLRERLTRPHG
ncbi:MAG: ATP-binding protein [Hyphomicrobium denitrificans]|nr:ATP-binding protein [Hyphomicrobium denitrificans]